MKSTLLLTSVALSTVAEKPNMVIILADDLGWGDVGFNGQKKINTPNIDKLAKDGAVFSNFYAGSAVCGPSRAVLLTGRHTGQASIRNNPKFAKDPKACDLQLSDNTFAKEMKKAGYATAVYGKWGLDENNGTDSGHPMNQGFDEFCGFLTHNEAHFHWAPYVWENRKKVDLGGKKNWTDKLTYTDDLFTDKGLKFIDKNAGKKPFCVFLSYTVPHLGSTAPKESWKQYEDLGWPKGPKSKGHYNDDPNTNVAYAAMVTKLDDYVGAVRKHLEKLGIADNTMILFTSDNGPEFDSKNFFDSNGIYQGKKRDLYEGGIKVPGVAYWPGTIKPNTIVEKPYAFWDVLPTFCDLAGTKPSAKTDGVSFIPAVKGKKEPSRPFLYWEYNKMGALPQQAARFGKWKVYRLYNGDNTAPVELYNLKDDPSESKDVSGQYPEVADQGKKVLASARVDSPNFDLKKGSGSGKKGKGKKKSKKKKK